MTKIQTKNKFKFIIVTRYSHELLRTWVKLALKGQILEHITVVKSFVLISLIIESHSFHINLF